MFKIVIGIGKNSNKKYSALVCDLGYRKAFCNFDTQLCAELLNMTIPDMMNLSVGEYEIFRKE